VKKRRGRGAGRTPLTWLSVVLVIYLAAPLVVFLARSAAHPGQGFAVPGLWVAFTTSLEAATISSALVALFGVPLAYWLARSPSRVAAVAGTLVQLPLALPPLMSGVVLLYVFGNNTPLGRLSGGRLTESVAGIVIAQSFVSSPFLVIAARSAFERVPRPLEDVGATAGWGPTGRFWHVALPVAAPGIRAGLLLAWLRAFGEYGATVMMSYYPLSLPVFTYVQFSALGLPATQAPAVLSLAAAAAVVAFSRLRPPGPTDGRPAQPWSPRWASTWPPRRARSTSSWPTGRPATVWPSSAPPGRASP
jgi:molybdate transport system ATP-binding protein/molybdate transport system permease protein